MILNYHSVHPTAPHSTDPVTFREQMGLVKGCAEAWSISEPFPQRLSESDRLSVAITFDDGYEDNFQYAFPVLQSMGLPATVFVTTGFIGGDTSFGSMSPHYAGLKPLSWQQMREMARHRITFGAHNHNHVALGALSRAEAENEIFTSKRILEEGLGHAVDMFAYPYGMPSHFNQESISILRQNGFRIACSAVFGSNTTLTNPFELFRIRIDSCDTMEDFAAKLFGCWDFIGWYQRLFR